MVVGKLKIILEELSGIDRTGEVATVAIPCPRGKIVAHDVISLYGPDGRSHSCQQRVLKKWPDGTVKWLLLDFKASASAGTRAEYTLRAGGARIPLDSPVVVRESGDVWEIDSGRAIFTVGAGAFPIASVRAGGIEVLQPGGAQCTLSMNGTGRGTAAVDAIALEESGPLRAVLRLTGFFQESTLRFSCRLHFFSGNSAVRFEFTIHNPAPARHSRGLWDLGDAGSVLLKSLDFSFRSSQGEGESCCIAAPGAPPLLVPPGARFSLYQESSGGQNWRSAVHRNREGKVTLERCGYVCEIDGKEASAGGRATPVVWHGKGELGIAVAIPQFWENFPGEITAGGGKVEVSPFPARFPDLHELQGGEQKSYELWVDFAAQRDSLVSTIRPVVAKAASEVYRKSEIFLDLPGDDDIVDLFASADDLLRKRERADEYGWRNFGDIYADHESAYHDGQETFVSHYNNQYDFLGGLYRKFFVTGNHRWGQLARDLARHVLDIDIYHTDQDREEYNHGLFWHTDHYVDAGTSTHRSFSGYHLNFKAAELCGGGPGAEHCYTTGLMLHYFHTGDPKFREAVLDLARWGCRSLEGPQTVLAALKRGAGYLLLWLGSRNAPPLFPRYPMTRGTGNVISACLDAFELGGGREFLEHAAHLVCQTVHPEDDIARRNLLEGEVAWSYTVLLTAVVKFLDKKFELGEIDAVFAHARASLVRYAEWMLAHEYPYLDKPEILEFPNETWAAQDLRKSVIFNHAARYEHSAEKRRDFIEKGVFFCETAVAELLRHRSSRYARPVALMLQNGWAAARLRIWDDTEEAVCFVSARAISRPAPELSLASVAGRALSDLGRALRQTSLWHELAWLKARM